MIYQPVSLPVVLSLSQHGNVTVSAKAWGDITIETSINGGR